MHVFLAIVDACTVAIVHACSMGIVHGIYYVHSTYTYCLRGTCMCYGHMLCIMSCRVHVRRHPERPHLRGEALHPRAFWGPPTTPQAENTNRLLVHFTKSWFATKLLDLSILARSTFWRICFWRRLMDLLKPEH